MKWFGEPWPSADLRAPICENDADRVETPVGSACLLCTTPIEADHRGVIMNTITAGPTMHQQPVHIECDYRNIVGNHLHVTGQCSHVGECNEKSTLSYREEALEVWRIMGMK